MVSEGNPYQREVNVRSLDLKVIWKSILPPFIAWLAVLFPVAFAKRQPGAVRGQWLSYLLR